MRILRQASLLVLLLSDQPLRHHCFRATTVPVGEDQLPMLEQCKEIVHKFNTVYGETLTEPEIILPSNKACLRLPGIDREKQK